MATNQVVITDGTHTVTLTRFQKPTQNFPTYIGEIPIPNREGGQIQYLGSPQHTFTVNGVLIQTSGGTDDFASFEPGGALDLIRKNTAADTTVTITYSGTQILSATTRIKRYSWWTANGAVQPWGFFIIEFIAKG